MLLVLTAHILRLTAKHLLLYLKAVEANLVSTQGKQRVPELMSPKHSPSNERKLMYEYSGLFTIGWVNSEICSSNISQTTSNTETLVIVIIIIIINFLNIIFNPLWTDTIIKFLKRIGK